MSSQELPVNDCDMYEMYQKGAIGNASMDIESLIETGGPA